jgi:hypothetical protein
MHCGSSVLSPLYIGSRLIAPGLARVARLARVTTALVRLRAAPAERHGGRNRTCEIASVYIAAESRFESGECQVALRTVRSSQDCATSA